MKGTGLIHDDFLLQNEAARRLYHEYASDLPILDYHNHLSPQLIAEDHLFANITEAWLGGDHYKWRAMRANGVDESFVTGSASPEAKFSKWAYTVPYTARNPLYHWTHLELKRYFDIDDLLHKDNADSIYRHCNDNMRSTRSLLSMMKVALVCTTDDPCDTLQYHAATNSDDLKLLPTFRPDRFLQIQSPQYIEHLIALESASNTDINSLDELLIALQQRVSYFAEHGGFIADHGLNYIPVSDTGLHPDQIFKKRLNHKHLTVGEVETFQYHILVQLGKMYHKLGWTMQLHLGAIRNNNKRLLDQVGADVGCDSIGDFSQAEGLSLLLNELDTNDELPKTILYNLNPRDNEVFATMAGNYQDGKMLAKVQWGSAWWFLDQKDGMEKQINALSNMGLLSRFIGMLTDSRSFLSFPRHEYFRRILCNLIGQDIIDGLLPNDEKWLGGMVQDICYNNAKRYFGI